jgi:hypothetical protein
MIETKYHIEDENRDIIIKLEKLVDSEGWQLTAESQDEFFIVDIEYDKDCYFAALQDHNSIVNYITVGCHLDDDVWLQKGRGHNWVAMIEKVAKIVGYDGPF